MEGEKIYEESYKQLTNIIKNIGSDSVTIDFSKMDVSTAGKIRDSIRYAAIGRQSELISVISGVK